MLLLTDQKKTFIVTYPEIGLVIDYEIIPAYPKIDSVLHGRVYRKTHRKPGDVTSPLVMDETTLIYEVRIRGRKAIEINTVKPMIIKKMKRDIHKNSVEHHTICASALKVLKRTLDY